MYQMKNSRPSVLRKDIDDMERRTSIKLPDSLRQFYMTQNGGRPIPRSFLKDREYYSVHYFLNIRPPISKSDFEEFFNLATADPEHPHPDWLVTFATDEGGDDFTFSLRNEDEGAIYYISHEHWDQPDLYITYLAPSFEVFMNELVERPAK